jgi:Flp pilus assembly CpaE family ATPase
MFSFSNLNKESVYDIEEYEAYFSVIDLPKSINEYWLYVLSKSDVVIVPYEHSLMDYIKLRALWGFIYKEPLIKSRVFFLCNKASETRAKKNVANIENLFGESLSLSTKFSLPDIPFSNTIAMRPLNESLTKTEAELIRPLCTTLLKSVF